MDTFYKSYTQIIKMLYRRETITAEKHEELQLTPHEFSIKYNSNIASLDILGLTSRTGIPTCVLFHKEDLTVHKTNDIFMNLLTGRLTGDEISANNIIIVFPLLQNAIAGISTTVPIDLYKREKKILKEKGISVQFFTTWYTSIPLLEHVLMPKFRLITNLEEREKILAIAKAKHMNIILSSDPVSRYFGAQNGDIFEILRRGKEGVQIIWRKVQEI
jgi:DNA-directed RNA polymerase subunit H (RpoH/RPB5)